MSWDCYVVVLTERSQGRVREDEVQTVVALPIIIERARFGHWPTALEIRETLQGWSESLLRCPLLASLVHCIQVKGRPQAVDEHMIVTLPVCFNPRL